jgi:nitrogen fixation protein NifU and related proteins
MLPESVARELIAQHQRRPRHQGVLDGAPWLRLDNPSCGDVVTLWLADDEVLQLSFEGKGCVISQVSASMLSAALTGQTRAQARTLSAHFRAMVMGEGEPDPSLGELQALAGVSRLHARRRCALLAWRALDALLDGALPEDDQAQHQTGADPAA